MMNLTTNHIVAMVGLLSSLIAFTLFFIRTEKLKLWGKLCIFMFGALLVYVAYRESIFAENIRMSSEENEHQYGAIVTPQSQQTLYAYPTPSATGELSSNYDELGWGVGVTKQLKPLHVAIGDVEVNGKIYYDVNGTDQSTFVVNMSKHPVTVYSQWGAGEIVLSSNTNEAQEQLDTRIREEFDSEYKFSNIRLVTITETGDITQSYFYRVALKTEGTLSSSDVTPNPYVLGWGSQENKPLLPLHVVIGDVKVRGKIYYDVGGKEKESTIVVNMSSDPIDIYAQWGAGERILSDDASIVEDQIATIISDEFNTGYNFRQIRLVTISSDGQVNQEIIPRNP